MSEYCCKWGNQKEKKNDLLISPQKLIFPSMKQTNFVVIPPFPIQSHSWGVLLSKIFCIKA